MGPPLALVAGHLGEDALVDEALDRLLSGRCGDAELTGHALGRDVGAIEERFREAQGRVGHPGSEQVLPGVALQVDEPDGALLRIPRLMGHTIEEEVDPREGVARRAGLEQQLVGARCSSTGRPRSCCAGRPGKGWTRYLEVLDEAADRTPGHAASPVEIDGP
jgi:hypothetical protein